jgi:hypothetical protein
MRKSFAGPFEETGLLPSGCQYILRVFLYIDSLPNFKLDRGIVQSDRLCQKSGTDGGFLELEKLVADESHDEAGLADRRVSQ